MRRAPRTGGPAGAVPVRPPLWWKVPRGGTGKAPARVLLVALRPLGGRAAPAPAQAHLKVLTTSYTYTRDQGWENRGDPTPGSQAARPDNGSLPSRQQVAAQQQPGPCSPTRGPEGWRRRSGVAEGRALGTRSQQKALFGPTRRPSSTSCGTKRGELWKGRGKGAEMNQHRAGFSQRPCWANPGPLWAPVLPW